MVRRIYNPAQYESYQGLLPMNRFITTAAILLFIAQLPFVFNFFWSLFAGKKAAENPWEATTLEWTTPSPPPHGNWPGAVPEVHRGPYDYSLPGEASDWLPQNQPDRGAASARG
ncbi:MAG: cytochrome c oxidase subunit I, partial [bacterium]|nr:cytochrome c oxidase subunit I [bacterium]